MFFQVGNLCNSYTDIIILYARGSDVYVFDIHIAKHFMQHLLLSIFEV